MSYFILIVISLALVGAGFFVRRRSLAAGQTIIIIGCLGATACLAWQLRENVFPPAGDGPDRGQAVVSYFLAGQVLEEMGGQQESVVLVFPPESVMDTETVGTYAGTFNRVLRGFPGLRVETITLDVPSKLAKTGKIPLSAFQQAASNAPTAKTFVSFAGVPADIEKFQPANARLFVFDPWGTKNWLPALKKGQIRSVIVPRPGVRASDAAASGEPQEAFNRLYLMATPANADKIAGEIKSN